MSLDLSFIVLLLVWASLGEVYWRMRDNYNKNLEVLKKIEKRLAALEKQNS